MVPYEATPARVALELVDRVNFRRGDVFYDLGSGLGQTYRYFKEIANR